MESTTDAVRAALPSHPGGGGDDDDGGAAGASPRDHSLAQPTRLHPPTPADVALHFSRFDVWYPLFKRHAPKATVIADLDRVEPGFAAWLEQDGLVLPEGSEPPGGSQGANPEGDGEGKNGDDDDDDDEDGRPALVPPRFDALTAKIRETIESYDGAVFPKMVWSAPLDAAWIVAGASLRCTTPADVYMLLKASDFIAKDVAQARELEAMTSQSSSTSSSLAGATGSAPRPRLSLALKKWFDMPTSHEFRCFVRDGRLVALCQRDVGAYFEHLQRAETRRTVRERVADFFHAHLALPRSSVGAPPSLSSSKSPAAGQATRTQPRAHPLAPFDAATPRSAWAEVKKGEALPMRDYVFDVYLTRDMSRLFLVDVDAMLPGRTEALLWTWDEVEAEAERLAAAEQAEAEAGGNSAQRGAASEARRLPPLRLVTSESEARGGAAPRHASNRVPRDVVEASEGRGVAEFAQRWQRELAEAVAEGEADEGGAKGGSGAQRLREGPREQAGKAEKDADAEQKEEPEGSMPGKDSTTPSTVQHKHDDEGTRSGDREPAQAVAAVGLGSDAGPGDAAARAPEPPGSPAARASRGVRFEEDAAENRDQGRKEGTAAARADDDADKDEADDAAADGARPSIGRASIFAALGEEQGAAEDEDEDEGENGEGEGRVGAAAPAPSARSKKKAAKKRKKQQQQQQQQQQPASGDASIGDAQSGTAAATPPRNQRSARTAPTTAAAKKRAVAAAKAATAAAGKKAAAKDISSMSMDELNALLAQADVKPTSSPSARDASNGGDARGGGGATGGTHDGHDDDEERARAEAFAALRPLLSLAAPALDPLVELKRQFGSAAIRAFEASDEAGGGGGGGGGAGGGGRGARSQAAALNSNLRGRNVLAQPRETWPPIARTFTGMSMELVDDGLGHSVASWVHSRAYKSVELRFLEAVRTYDPNQLVALWQHYPWHVNTLLQLSEVSRHQGDLGQASDWNSRLLFAYEKTALASFVSGLTSSSGPPVPCLGFERVENRGLWLASHRHVNFLGRRGTWRTALEWAKLLLALDPSLDPHAVSLWIDFLAIKARQHRWLLELLPRLDAVLYAEYREEGPAAPPKQEAAEAGEKKREGGETEESFAAAACATATLPMVPARTPFDDEDGRLVGERSGTSGASSDGRATWRGTLDWCLGLMYARALALRAVEREENDKTGQRSTAALRLAIARHPAVLPLLFDKVGISMRDELRSHPLMQLPDATSGQPRRSPAGDDDEDVVDEREAGRVEAVLAHVYVARNESLWKDAEVGAWLASTLASAWPRLRAAYDEAKKAAAATAKKGSNEPTGRTPYEGSLRWRPPRAWRDQCDAVYRHVLVSDLPDALRQTLVGYLPSHVTSSAEALNAWDPLPPTWAGSTRYDDEYFAPVLQHAAARAGRGGGGGGGGAGPRGGAEEAAGGVAAAEQFAQMLRGLVQRFVGGADAAERLDDETREDIIAQLMQNPAAMPGGFGGEGADEDGWDDEDDEEEEAASQEEEG